MSIIVDMTRSPIIRKIIGLNSSASAPISDAQSQLQDFSSSYTAEAIVKIALGQKHKRKNKWIFKSA